MRVECQKNLFLKMIFLLGLLSKLLCLQRLTCVPDGINVPHWNFFDRLNKRAGTFIQYSRVSWKKGTSMRYARVSASQIQFCPGIGHQWRKIRLRKDRDAGGANQGAPGDLGEGHPGVSGA